MPSAIQLAIAQVSPRKGDYSANLAHLGEVFAQAHSLTPRPHVLHLPETALTGYFVEGGVGDLAMAAGELAHDLNRVYRDVTGGTQPLDVVAGFYEVWTNTLYNSAMYVTVGADSPAIRHVHRKNFLPTYGLFDEERFVERGHDIRAFDTSWGRAAILVCEDAWHSLTGTLLALDGAEMIFISSAAPARGVWPREDAIPGPASVARWERLVRDIAEEHGVFVSFANLSAIEGGKAFPGGSMVAGPRGDIRVRGPLWEDAIVTIGMDLADLTRARAEMPLLADLRTALPHLIDNLDQIREGGSAGVEYDDVSGNGRVASPPSPNRRASASDVGIGAESATAGPLRVVQPELGSGHGPHSLDIDGPLLERWLTHFIREELEQRGFAKGIVAVSGGVDSAVTAFLGARALGPENVIALRLPYSTSSADSLEHAQLVIDALGITAQTIDISPAVDGYLASDPGANDGRRGNIMARVRMIALFDLSAKHHAIPLGTGNKTERLLGYFTWHADDSPPVNPLGDLYKTQVWALARHLGVPSVIVDKPATADLVAGQTDEGDLGISYPKADQILHWLLSGYSAESLQAQGLSQGEIERVRKRLEGTHWKRRLPTVAMLSPTAIGESYLRPVDY